MDSVGKKHGLSLILLHGSQVDGRVHKKSDVDIAVLRRNVNKKLDLLALIYSLSEKFENDKIDVLDLTTADPLTAFAVARKNKLLSGSKQDYDKFLKKAFMKYGDYVPYLEKEREFVKQKIERYVAN